MDTVEHPKTNAADEKHHQPEKIRRPFIPPRLHHNSMDTSLNPNAQSFQPHIFFPQKQIEDKIELNNDFDPSSLELNEKDLMIGSIEDGSDDIKGNILDKKLSTAFLHKIKDKSRPWIGKRGEFLNGYCIASMSHSLKQAE